MIDPHVISIGGGLSNAFNYFNKVMIDEIKKYSPSYSINDIKISSSLLKEKSTMIGACLLVKSIKNI